MFGSTQFPLLFILGIFTSVFLPMHSELLCFIDSYNLKRALFSSLAPPQTTSWHLAAFFFSFLCIFVYGSLVLSQPKLNCDTEYWLHGLFSPSLQERLYLIWAKVLYSREGELHVNDLPLGWREVFGRCLNSEMRDFMAQRFDNNLTCYYFPHTL